MTLANSTATVITLTIFPERISDGETLDELAQEDLEIPKEAFEAEEIDARKPRA